jgi:hypothetical protein
VRSERTIGRKVQAHRDPCLAFEAGCLVNPSEENRAASLRGLLADAPSRRGDVLAITRRVGERTALAGRRWLCRLRPCRLRMRAECEVRGAACDRVPHKRIFGMNSRWHAIGRRLSERTIRTCRSRRAAGMFGFGSARALSSRILPRNVRVLPAFFFCAAKAQLGAEFRPRTIILHC